MCIVEVLAVAAFVIRGKPGGLEIALEQGQGLAGEPCLQEGLWLF